MRCTNNMYYNNTPNNMSVKTYKWFKRYLLFNGESNLEHMCFQNIF